LHLGRADRRADIHEETMRLTELALPRGFVADQTS
jgi:hypothetical protein